MTTIASTTDDGLFATSTPAPDTIGPSINHWIVGGAIIGIVVLFLIGYSLVAIRFKWRPFKRRERDELMEGGNGRDKGVVAESSGKRRNGTGSPEGAGNSKERNLTPPIRLGEFSNHNRQQTNSLDSLDNVARAGLVDASTQPPHHPNHPQYSRPAMPSSSNSTDSSSLSIIVTASSESNHQQQQQQYYHPHSPPSPPLPQQDFSPPDSPHDAASQVTGIPPSSSSHSNSHWPPSKRNSRRTSSKLASMSVTVGEGKGS